MKKSILLFLSFMICMNMFAGKPSKTFKLYLWPEGAPHQSVDPKDTAWVEVSLPKDDAVLLSPGGKEASGTRAVVICPGGGYTHLAMDHEGRQWMQFYNSMSIAAIVLHYRMPHGDCRIPQEDAIQALRLVREKAAEWNINPNDVGIQGSSAGGHLASTIATHAEDADKPNFQILFYPVISMDLNVTHKGSHDNFLGKNPTKDMEHLYTNELQVNEKTPKAWIVLANDDSAVPPINSLSYATALNAHRVPVSLHLYPTGGHGFGAREIFEYHIDMEQELRDWLIRN